MTENSLNSFWSSSMLISVIIGGCVLLLMYIIRLFKNDNQKGKVTSVKNVTRHSEKEPSAKGKKKSTETKWAARVDKQHSYTHPWLLTTLKGHTGHVLDMDFSSNGKYLASCAEEPDPGGFADIDTSSSTSSSVEDAPLAHPHHLHSSPGPLNSKETSSAVRKPALSRRQRKNRRREDTVPLLDKKKNNRRFHSNHSAMFQPLREHTVLNMPDAHLSMLLQKYLIPYEFMRLLSYPTECPVYPGRAVVLKTNELPPEIIRDYYNNLNPQRQQQQQQQQQQPQQQQPQQLWPQLPFNAIIPEYRVGYDVHGREYFPNGPVTFFYNAHTVQPFYYGAHQAMFKQTTTIIEVRQYLQQIQPPEIHTSNSSDDDFPPNNIPSAVYTRSNQTCAFPKSSSTAEPAHPDQNIGANQFLSARSVFKKPVRDAAEEDKNCSGCKKPKISNNTTPKKNRIKPSAKLVLSPRSLFKQSVWEAAEESDNQCDTCKCTQAAGVAVPAQAATAAAPVAVPAPAANNGAVARQTQDSPPADMALNYEEDESSTASSSVPSSTSSRSQSSEALYEDTESSSDSVQSEKFHYSPEGNRCTCKNNECTDGLPDILVDSVPGVVPGEPRICARCNRMFYMTQTCEYISTERCHYHWGKLQRMFSQPESGYASSEQDQARKQYARVPLMEYTCCGMGEGTPGCTRGKLHVWNGIEFGLNGPYDTFVRTRPRRIPSPDGNYGLYAIDCEMCYTSRGLELTKVTVVASDGRLVYDSLVRPDVPIIDYNTKYSGISERDLNRKGVYIKSLKDVQNDLMGFISADTILVGHGLENDLRALKIIHGRVVDTAIAFPHQGGLPMRRSLKSLVNSCLNRDIQTSTNGHSSYEDARACMELMLYRIRKEFADQVNQ